MGFDSLGLSAALLKSLEAKGYREPTPIQAEAIPAVLSGRDVLAAAQTGTGKTAGFTLPLLQRLSEVSGPKGPRPIRALILTPTRELAAQVAEHVVIYGEHLKLRSAVVFGGVPLGPQKSQLRSGVDVLVATPGRLMDLLDQQLLSLSQLECLVLDEADRMLDMGFIPAVRKLVKGMPRQRQTLMFSATFSKEILQLTTEFLDDPVSIQVAADNAAADRVEQQVYHLAKSQKAKCLQLLIQSKAWEQVLVFTRTKHGADRLCRRLLKQKISSVAIHGGKTQAQRVKALKRFKERELRVMVATDIAARGIDIKALPHVVNYELPNVPEDYVHRIGRTGRAGQEGHAVSLVCGEEKPFLARIEKLMGQKMEVLSTAGFDLPEPVEQPTQKVRSAASGQARSKATKKTQVKPKPKTTSSSFGKSKAGSKNTLSVPGSQSSRRASTAKQRRRTKLNPLSSRPAST